MRYLFSSIVLVFGWSVARADDPSLRVYAPSNAHVQNNQPEQIFVMYNNVSYTFEIPLRSKSANDLADAIEARLGIPRKYFYLTFGHRILSGEGSLAGLGVVSLSSVRLEIRCCEE